MTTRASRSDLIDYLASEHDLPKTKATSYVDTVLKGIVALAETGLTIREFGRFDIRQRAARVNKSGFGGVPTAIPARRALAFSAAPGLVDRAGN